MSEQYPVEETQRVPAGTTDRVIEETPRFAGTRATAPVTRTEYRETMFVPRDHVRWGPVVAGTAVGLGFTIIMSVLGLAIGSSAFEPGTDITDWTTSAGIWGIVTAIVAFFAAGWVAGRAAATDDAGSSALNGFVAGAALLVTLIWMTAVGTTNMIGFLGSNFSNVTSFATNAGAGGATFNDIEDGAWATFAVMLVGMILAAIGGFLGHQESDEYAPTI